MEHIADYSEILSELLFALCDLNINSSVLLVANRLEESEKAISASCLVELARIRWENKEFPQALHLYKKALVKQDELNLRHLAITIKGIADAELQIGNIKRASQLYKMYRENDTGILSAWGTYQLAALASSDGSYKQAITLFRSICERETFTPWKDEACTRLNQARQLQDIEIELKKFGHSLHTR